MPLALILALTKARASSLLSAPHLAAWCTRCHMRDGLPSSASGTPGCFLYRCWAFFWRRAGGACPNPRTLFLCLPEFWELPRIPASVRAAPAVRGEFAQANSNAGGGTPTWGGVPRRISAGKKPGAAFRAGALRRAQFVPPARHGSGGTNWSTRVPPDLSIPMAPGARSPVFAVALPNSTVFGSFGKNAYFFLWRRAPPQRTTRGGPGGAEPPRLNGSAQRRIPGGFSPAPS